MECFFNIHITFIKHYKEVNVSKTFLEHILVSVAELYSGFWSKLQHISMKAPHLNNCVNISVTFKLESLSAEFLNNIILGALLWRRETCMRLIKLIQKGDIEEELNRLEITQLSGQMGFWQKYWAPAGWNEWTRIGKRAANVGNQITSWQVCHPKGRTTYTSTRANIIFAGGWENIKIVHDRDMLSAWQRYAHCSDRSVKARF